LLYFRQSIPARYDVNQLKQPNDAIATMIFGQAGPKDWEAVRGLLGSCSLPIDGAQRHLADFLLAFEDGALAACGGLECYGDVALLRSVAVAPHHRGRGLGRELCGGLVASAIAMLRSLA